MSRVKSLATSAHSFAWRVRVRPVGTVITFAFHALPHVPFQADCWELRQDGLPIGKMERPQYEHRVAAILNRSDVEVL